MEAKDFRTFSPKVLAGIRDLPGLSPDRTIPIVLKRKAPGATSRGSGMKRVRAEAARSGNASRRGPRLISHLWLTLSRRCRRAHDHEEDVWEPLVRDRGSRRW